MNDLSLKERLQTLPVPTPSDAGRGRALHRAKIALVNRAVESRNFFPVARKRWLCLTGAAVLILVFGWNLHRVENPTPTLAVQRDLMRQMEALFPDQLNAIIECDGRLNLILNEYPGTTSDQTVLVTFSQQGRTVRVASYSGRKVCLKVEGRTICFEMLITDNGKVILSGDDFLWSESHRVLVGGYRVQATSLNQPS